MGGDTVQQHGPFLIQRLGSRASPTSTVGKSKDQRHNAQANHGHASHPISKPEYLVLHSLSLISPLGTVALPGRYARFFCLSLRSPPPPRRRPLIISSVQVQTGKVLDGSRQAGDVVMCKLGRKRVTPQTGHLRVVHQARQWTGFFSRHGSLMEGSPVLGP